MGSLFEKKFEKRGDDQEAMWHYFNTAVIFDPQGKMSHFTRKQHIPSGTFV